MAYSALPSKVTLDILTMANYDAIKGNFEAGVPDIFTTKGDIAAATAANAAARLAVGANGATLTPDSSQASGLAWQIQPAASVKNSIAIDPATSTWVTLTFDTEDYDTDACHSTATNTGRLTVPTGGAGKYRFGGNVQFATDGTGVGGKFGVRVLKNGTTVLVQKFLEQTIDAGDLALDISGEAALVVTDYLELQVYTTLDVNIEAELWSPRFYFSFFRR